MHDFFFGIEDLNIAIYDNYNMHYTFSSKLHAAFKNVRRLNDKHIRLIS